MPRKLLLSICLAFSILSSAIAQKADPPALTGLKSVLRDGMSIVFFGDSITDQGGYIRMIEAAIHADPAAAKHQVKLINRGLNGAKVRNLRDGGELYGDKQPSFDAILAQDKPAVAVMYIGINDVWHGKDGTTPEDYAKGLRDLIERCRAAGASVILATPTVIGEKADGTNPLDKQLDEYAAIVRATARESCAVLCDLRSAFIETLRTRNAENKDKGILTYDGVHLSEAGNKLIAEKLTPALVEAIQSQADFRFEPHHHPGPAGTNLPYRLLRPAKIEPGAKYPLMVFLHGIGERGDDNRKQLVWGKEFFLQANREHQSFIIVPQCPEEETWTPNIKQFLKVNPILSADPTPPMALVIDLIKTAPNDLPIDPNRVYIAGLSMGGYGTWDIAARNPELFAAAAAICGGGDPNQAKKLAQIPIWAFHGDNDTAVPVDRSRQIVEAVKQAGGKIKYTEYPGVDHLSWIPAFKEPELLTWLYSNKRGK